MKLIKYFIILILSSGLLLSSSSIIQSFTAKSNGNDITIEWRTSLESTVRRFEIERSASSNIFSRIATEDAKGTPTKYTYIDSEAFFKSEGGGNSTLSKTVYSYRLKIIYDDNKSEYTDQITVTHNVSGIRRTWGMIKEMFR